jgi:CubicO group peptidase (beta-lactamase class C family)
LRCLRLLWKTGLTLFLISVWSLLFVYAGLKGWGKSAIAPFGDAGAFAFATLKTIEADSKGNVAFVLLEDGKPFADVHRSAGEPVTPDTLFQVASLSKWITAWGVMALAEDGRIDLDAPVSTYISRWAIPPSEFDADQVTVRRLLSHTGGLTDGLGYMGFAPGTDIQSLEASLSRAADAAPLLSGKVKLGAAPDDQWRYSGGGYTLLQLMIEEVSGEEFSDYMKRAVLDPLGMTQSTFDIAPDDPRLAEFYDAKGALTPHRQYTATAAASLYTSAADLTRFLQAHLEGDQGEPPGRGVLSPGALEAMRAPHGFVRGKGVWGLGTILYTPDKAGGSIIGHDGGNAPAIRTAARLDPQTGDGIIVLSTGSTRLATDIADEWIHWKTGSVSPLNLNLIDARSIVVMAMSGPSAQDVPAMLIWMAGVGAILIFVMRGFRKRAR